MKISGAKAQVFFDNFDPARVIDGDGVITTTPGTWYKIFEKGEESEIVFPENYIFRAPTAVEDQIVLKTGDKVYPFLMERICKTSADLSAEQGTIDASDDCDTGAQILDGNINISGSLGSLLQYNDLTGDFDNVTDLIVSKFFETVTDDGAGHYELSPRNDDDVFMLVNINSHVKAGQTEIWMALPIIISSMSMSFGNTDIQNKDMSWNKGSGPGVVYKAPRAA